MDERRSYQRAMLITGLALAGVGAITWMIAGAQVAYQQNVSAFSAAVGSPATGALNAAVSWMWAGIIALIVGAVLVIVVVAIRAAVGSSGPALPTYAERMRDRQNH